MHLLEIIIQKVKIKSSKDYNEVLYVSVAQKLPEIWLKSQRYQYCDFCVLVKKIHNFLQKRKNCKIGNFMLSAISQAIFELQRRTIPHFNPLNKSF